jgi:hypothetical protein
MFKSKNIKWVLVVLAVFVLAGTVIAFAASNTVPSSKAGDGSGAVSGYVVSSVQVVLNGTDPTKIDAIKFALDSTATTVQARFLSTDGWYTCSNASNVWTCATTSPQLTVSAMDSLRVIAIQ